MFCYCFFVFLFSYLPFSMACGCCYSLICFVCSSCQFQLSRLSLSRGVYVLSAMHMIIPHRSGQRSIFQPIHHQPSIHQLTPYILPNITHPPARPPTHALSAQLSFSRRCNSHLPTHPFAHTSFNSRGRSPVYHLSIHTSSLIQVCVLSLIHI